MPGIDELRAFLNGAGGIVALMVAVGAFRDRWPVSWLLKRLVSEPIDDRISANPTVKAIHQELHPNGGSSLRDVVDRTELRVARVEKHVGLDAP